jgi:hypothetical protein
MITVTVRFTQGYQEKTYDYVADLETIAVGRHVVVDTPSSGYSVAKVMGMSKTISFQATKPIVCVVDDIAYNAEKVKFARRKAILSKVARIEKKVEEEARLQFLAQYSPEAAVLLKELKEL